MILTGIFTGIIEGICKLMILMVAGIYKLVSGVYQIFLVLSKTNLFEQDTYANLTDKVYIILAVVMLFVVAYSFITMIIDPDKNKGGKAVEDLIKKSITSLILIVICPTLFTFAFDLQDAIMDQDIIGKFFTTTTNDYDSSKSIKEGGNMMAATTFAAFFSPSLDSDTRASVVNKSTGIYDESGDYKIDCTKTESSECSLDKAIEYATHTGRFGVFTAFSLNWLENDSEYGIDFNLLLSIIAGFYLVYVIVSFCFDLAVRVIKLAFYQIIAPICIACRILPDKESIFKNWWKAVSKTYLSVFVRVFIMNLAVFLMVQLTETNFWDNICPNEEMDCTGSVKFFAEAFLIMGLITFIRQASKLIDEIFGLGDVKLGIASKLKEGGAFTAGAAIGAGVTTTAKNISHTVSNAHTAQGPGAKASAIIRGIGQTAAGTVRGTYSGAKSGWGAGSYKDMKNAAGAGAKHAVEVRDEIEDYRKEHDLGPIAGTMPVIGGIAYAAHKVKDKALDVVDWAGVNNTEELLALKDQTDKIVKAIDSVKDAAKDTLIKDATVKGKFTTYGIDQTTKKFDYEYKDSSGRTRNINFATGQEVRYNSATYGEMDKLLKQARANGAATVSFHGQTIDTGVFESMMSNFSKKMSEEMSTVASMSQKDWETYRTTHASEARDLDKVRSASTDARIVLETNKSATVIQTANDLAPAGTQKITPQNIADVQLDFTSGAINKMGDAGKDTTQTINDKIKARQKQKAEAGKKKNSN